MGKTLIGILEIAAAIAVQFIPGLGTVAGISIGLSLAATGFQTLLTKGPAAQKPDTIQTSVKSPLAPRVRAYGKSRLYAAYVTYSTTAGSAAIDVYAFADTMGVPIDGVERIYLADQHVAQNAGVVNGMANGQYGMGAVEVDFRLGAATETSFSQVVAQLGNIWTDQHRGDGVVSGMAIFQSVSAQSWQQVYPNGQGAMSIVARWQRVYDWRDASQSLTDPTTWKWTENAVLHLVDYTLIVEKAHRSADEMFPSADALNAAWAKYFAPYLTTWTAAANDADVRMALKGVETTLVLDVAAGATTITIADNNGLSAGMSIEVASTLDISHTETVTVNAVSGGTVTFHPAFAYAHPQGSGVRWTSKPSSPATEARYRSCVSLKLTDAHKDTKARIIACFDGWVAQAENGALICHSGRYYDPTVSLGPNEIVSYSLQEGIEDESAINDVAVTYFSANHDYGQVDAQNWQDVDDIEIHGLRSDSLQDDVPSHAQARRLAKRKQAQIMAPKSGSCTTNSGGRAARGERFVNINLTEAGTVFFSGPVEITALTRNLMTGGVTFQWRAADPNIDAWNPATEEGEPAQVGNLMLPAALDAPAITSATTVQESSNDAGDGLRVAITATGPDRTDLIWFARWRASGNPSWNEQQYNDLDPGPSVSLLTGFVTTNATIEVEVAYQVGDGRVSEWSDHVNVGSYIPLSPAIVAASETANWSQVVNDEGTRPADNATNSADPTSPFGNTGKTVSDIMSQIAAALAGSGADVTAIADALSRIEAGARQGSPNLIIGGDFPNLDGWHTTGGTWTAEESDTIGTYVACTTAGASELYRDFSIDPNTSYSLSLEQDDVSSLGQAYVVWLDSTGAGISPSISTLAVSSDDWVRAAALPETSPSTAVKARVVLRKEAAATGSVVGFTRVQFQAGPATNWRDDASSTDVSHKVTELRGDSAAYAEDISTITAQLAGTADSGLREGISTVDTKAQAGVDAAAAVASLSEDVSASFTSVLGALAGKADASITAGALADLAGKLTAYVKLTAQAGTSDAEITVIATEAYSRLIFKAGEFLFDGGDLKANSIYATKIIAGQITRQFGAVLGSPLTGDSGFTWQDGPTRTFHLDYDADVLIVATGGNSYTSGLPAFESAIAIDGTRGAGGNAGGAGSGTIPISMGNTVSLAAGDHTVTFQWRGGSAGIDLDQANLSIFASYR